MTDSDGEGSLVMVLFLSFFSVNIERKRVKKNFLVNLIRHFLLHLSPVCEKRLFLYVNRKPYIQLG